MAEHKQRCQSNVCKLSSVSEELASLNIEAPLHSLPIIPEPFTCIAMDVFGPLKRTKLGNKYILVVMDYTSKWPEAYALKNVTSETVVKCLVDLISRVGITEELLTDNEFKFAFKFIRGHCQTMGIKQIKTFPHHHQTDGMIEHFNAIFKTVLRKLIQNPKVEWDDCLPHMLCTYKGTIYETTGFSPYQMLFGRPIRMPLDQMVHFWKGKEESGQNTTIEFVETLKSNIEAVRDRTLKRETKVKESQKIYHDRKSMVREYVVGDFVLVFWPMLTSKLDNQWQVRRSLM